MYDLCFHYLSMSLSYLLWEQVSSREATMLHNVSTVALNGQTKHRL